MALKTLQAFLVLSAVLLAIHLLIEPVNCSHLSKRISRGKARPDNQTITHKFGAGILPINQTRTPCYIEGYACESTLDCCQDGDYFLSCDGASDQEYGVCSKCSQSGGDCTDDDDCCASYECDIYSSPTSSTYKKCFRKSGTCIEDLKPCSAPATCCGNDYCNVNSDGKASCQPKGTCSHKNGECYSNSGCCEGFICNTLFKNCTECGLEGNSCDADATESWDGCCAGYDCFSATRECKTCFGLGDTCGAISTTCCGSLQCGYGSGNKVVCVENGSAGSPCSATDPCNDGLYCAKDVLGIVGDLICLVIDPPGGIL